MYYLRLNNDDGSSEEIELQRGHIFCICHMCGQEIVPLSIEFARQLDSEGEYLLWNSCPDCSEKRKAEYHRQEGQMSHTALGSHSCIVLSAVTAICIIMVT